MEQNKLNQILQAKTLDQFHNLVKSSNCKRCQLSEYAKEIIVYRGNIKAKAILIGESPGRLDEAGGAPFIGPAGEFQEKGFRALGMPTNQYFLVTNVCLCRPAAPKGSGKENFTPAIAMRKKCVIFAEKMIELLNPKLIIAVGGVAAQTLLKLDKVEPGWVTKNAGKMHIAYNRPCYMTVHPAYILHSQSQGSEKFMSLKKLYWEQLITLKKIYEEICGV